jgi:tRNA-binding EMAP/Myf-like protein
MRGNISEDMILYIQELEEEIKNNQEFADEIVTIDDQIMTAKQAVNLLKENSLTSRTYNARKS